MLKPSQCLIDFIYFKYFCDSINQCAVTTFLSKYQYKGVLKLLHWRCCFRISRGNLAQDAAFSYEWAASYCQLNYNWDTSGSSRFSSSVKAAKSRHMKMK